MSTEAKIIADSISPEGVRLVTMQVTFHRFVLSEFNTHRVFSRNSASSRAIPVFKQIERVSDDPAMPVSWPTEQKGMQGGAEVSGVTRARVEGYWKSARWAAVDHVRDLVDDDEEPIHKSVTNRLLEPFMWHTVVVTSTAWENFFALRLDTDAQPEIRVAAEFMKAAYDGSEPQPLREGQWHLPYVEFGVDDYAAADYLDPKGFAPAELILGLLAKISAARCARVSYLTQEGKRDIREDLRLYDRLVNDRLRAGKGVHWSPLEHPATPWPENRQDEPLVFRPIGGSQPIPLLVDHLPRVGNLLGWRSLRTEVEAMTGTVTFR